MCLSEPHPNRRPVRASSGTSLAPLATLAVLASLGIAGCAGVKTPEQKAAEARYAQAKALFEERCKTAGVVILRTVKDVEGIELTKVRPEIPWGGKEYFDPMFPGAAMAGEAQGSAYIRQFLWSEFRYTHSPGRRGDLASPTERQGFQQLPPTKGYQYVDVPDGRVGSDFATA